MHVFSRYVYVFTYIRILFGEIYNLSIYPNIVRVSPICAIRKLVVSINWRFPSLVLNSLWRCIFAKEFIWPFEIRLLVTVFFLFFDTSLSYKEKRTISRFLKRDLMNTWQFFINKNLNSLSKSSINLKGQGEHVISVRKEENKAKQIKVIFCVIV